MTAAQASYGLRCLRAHNLINRIPASHRYRVTNTGLHHTMVLTLLQARLLQPGLVQLTDPYPPAPSTLRTAARDYRRALDRHTQDAEFAASTQT